MTNEDERDLLRTGRAQIELLQRKGIASSECTWLPWPITRCRPRRVDDGRRAVCSRKVLIIDGRSAVISIGFRISTQWEPRRPVAQWSMLTLRVPSRWAGVVHGGISSSK
eukprot:8277216-Pyramimonas_sp.AAC.1